MGDKRNEAVAGYALSAANPAARLFEEYGDQLYRFCLGRLRSREDAEDALQSTFLRAHKALERGVVPEYEAAWLYKIAHNVCLTRRSVLARNGQTIPLHDREDVEIAVAAPESRSDELWGLPDALAGLSPNLRQAILLREWQGLSYAEIAEAMGTTVSAVETLIFRARRDLAARLAPERRRRPKLLDLLAALFGPKLAAGAALLALGGAGVGTAFELQRHTTTPPPAPAKPAPALASTPIGVAIAVPQHVRPAAAHRVTPAPAPAPAAREHPATATTVPAATVPAPAPAATQPQQEEPAATTVTPTVSPATTTAATTAVPTVEAPTVGTPTVAAPVVEPPTASLPAVTVPSVELPTVSVPAPPLDLGH
jgi:RNA polymerase sigma factor (sigma-70 family)